MIGLLRYLWCFLGAFVGIALSMVLFRVLLARYPGLWLWMEDGFTGRSGGEMDSFVLLWLVSSALGWGGFAVLWRQLIPRLFRIQAQ